MYALLFIQDYPAMYVMAARHDDVIPFEGVTKYVDKLQSCIKQHQCVARGLSAVNHAPRWIKVRSLRSVCTMLTKCNSDCC